MKKFIVSAFIIGAFVLYSFVYSRSNPVAVVPGNSISGSTSSTRSTTTPAGGTTPGATSPSPSGTTTASTTPGQYKNGTYTGSAADAYYGMIQVKAVIQQGKITDVQFLQAPNDRNQSVMINSYADPQLTQEAIQTQSANVNVVTGATDSSEAFIQSLTDALSQAKA
ncbi:FMN-binding protein [Ktedonobacteria bacterium brp13]|jgi:uncharacterized protein with FMN-binding domain|nr:FMN-binding protein [Ktedonobacteria bacterium brp13]